MAARPAEALRWRRRIPADRDPAWRPVSIHFVGSRGSFGRMTRVRPWVRSEDQRRYEAIQARVLGIVS